MEEKLRRQKEKGLHKQHENEDDENAVEENTTSSEEESSTEEPLSSNTVTEADAEEILGTKSVDSSAAPLVSNVISSTSTTSMPPYRYLARHQNHHVPSTSSVVLSQVAATASPHPKTIVESERLHVIEIKTDGSTGHLVRSTSGGGDYVSE